MMMPPSPTKLGGKDENCDICEIRTAKHFFTVMVKGVVMPVKLCSICYNDQNPKNQPLWF